MKYRTLSGTDLKVSEIGFGVWTVSTTWWGVTDPKVRTTLLEKGVDAGINFFDTADTYGDGLGETILAQVLGDKRKDLVIASKFGYDFYHHSRKEGHEELPQDWSPQYVRFALEESLKRLKTDYLDLYQLHNCRLDAIEREDTFAELDKLKTEGKIRAYGVALGPAIAPRQAEEGVQAIQKRKVNTVYIIYNLLEQMLGEAVLPAAQDQGASILVRVPHASGLLDGTVSEKTTFGKNDHRSHRVSSDDKKRLWQDQGLKKVEQLEFLTQGTGREMAQAAIQYILREPAITSVFPNIYNEKLLATFAGTSEVQNLTEAEIAKVDALYAENFGFEPAEVMPAQ
jgi:aryl-alcohol dehydrogenase-like predicted oxidoreductase